MHIIIKQWLCICVRVISPVLNRTLCTSKKRNLALTTIQTSALACTMNEEKSRELPVLYAHSIIHKTRAQRKANYLFSKLKRPLPHHSAVGGNASRGGKKASIVPYSNQPFLNSPSS